MDLEKYTIRVIKEIFRQLNITSQESFVDLEEQVFEAVDQFSRDLPSYVMEYVDTLSEADSEVEDDDFLEDE